MKKFFRSLFSKNEETSMPNPAKIVFSMLLSNGRKAKIRSLDLSHADLNEKNSFRHV